MKRIAPNERVFMLVPALLLSSGMVFAQSYGEASEPTPEALDAAFTAADAAREAAMFSDQIIDRSPTDPLAAATAAAEVVVRARVVGEQVHYDANDIPFTHTTFAIEELIAGTSPGAEFTLVQEGGPSRTDPEMVYMVSESHYFDTGAEEVLFLSVEPGTSAVDSPRVSVQQRFSVLDGRVYTESGRGLILTPSKSGAGQRVQFSADRHPDPRFREIRIGSHTFTRQYGGGGNQGDAHAVQTQERTGQASPPAAPSYRDSTDVNAFTAAISE
ncbi:MAG: hypothetical protein Hals2KO_28520 [Halioglobus sp.]